MEHLAEQSFINTTLIPVRDAIRVLDGQFESIDDAIRALRRLYTTIEAAEDALMYAKNDASRGMR